jgi:hypothetical protein
VLLRLRALKAKPEVTISLLDLGLSLDAAGYSQQDVREVLFAFEQEKIVAFGPGKRLRILRDLPQ